MRFLRLFQRNEPLPMLPVQGGLLDGQERRYSPTGWLTAQDGPSEHVWIIAQDCDGTRYWKLYAVRAAVAA